MKLKFKENRNVVGYGAVMSMILFFIAGIIGVMMNSAIAVRFGFVMAIISAIFVIFMIFKLRGEKE